MAELLADSIDFSAYMRKTEASVKVRAASVFADELAALFEPPPKGRRRPHMFSTKLRSAIEFRPGEVTVWAGFNGHRKSMFTGQVMLDLCVQRQRVLMASFEMTPARTLQRMARQATAMVEPGRSRLAEFNRWTDGRLWIFDHMGRIKADEVLAVGNYFAEELKGQHLLIDSFMMVCGSEEHMDEQKQFMTDTIRLAQETGLHVHLVAHARKPAGGGEDKPPTKYDIKGSSVISDQAHNVLTVWANKAKAAALERDPGDEDALAKPDALICLEKQRNGSVEGRYAMWFDDASLRFSDSRTSSVEPYHLTTDDWSEE